MRRIVGLLMVGVFFAVIVGLIVLAAGWYAILVVFGSIALAALFIVGLAWALGEDIGDHW